MKSPVCFIFWQIFQFLLRFLLLVDYESILIFVNTKQQKKNLEKNAFQLRSHQNNKQFSNPKTSQNGRCLLNLTNAN